MVKLLACINSKDFLKRKAVLAITLLVVVFSFSANFTLAAETKISAQEVERIKLALDIIKTTSNFGNILVDGGGLMKALNTVIKGGEVATNVTYGLLVLSAINEMEFIDMVLSQDYKDKARDYFNQILDERVNLRSYWKGVGFNIPRVLSGNITGPMGALTLNTFEMTDKVILILSAFKNLQTEKQYDGLWYYFDFRRGGDSHEEAWEMAESHMGWAAKPSFAFRGVKDVKNNDSLELEQQFTALYENWGSHTTPFGVSERYKEQAKSDLRNTVVMAVEESENAFAEESAPSLFVKLLAQLEDIKDAVVDLASKVNPFSAGPVLEPPAEEMPAQTDGAGDVGSPPTPEDENRSLPVDEPVPELGPETAAIEEPAPEVVPQVEPELVLEVTPEQEATTTEAMVEELALEITNTGRPLCQRGNAGTARQYRVLINEVAWMGSQDSPNDEWIELKNTWGIPVNLAGWQLQDKNQQIKVIFEEGDNILTGGYYLLERTDDNSLPDAQANKIYTGALGNNDEAIYLFDNNCQLEDEVLAMPDWSGGDNYSKNTMQRFDVLNWYSAPVTAGCENGSPPAILAHPSAPASASASSDKSYLKILITETQISPTVERFVELYNPNDAEANLSGWYIQKKTASGDSFESFITSTQFEGKVIQPHGYFLVARTNEDADIILGDMTLTKDNTLILKNPDRDIVDEVSTNDPSPGQSYGRIWPDEGQGYLDEFEIQTPTPGAQNIGLEEEGDEEDGEGTGNEPLAVVFNEIAWAGNRTNSADEWIELYNNTDHDVDLTGWKIKKDSEDWIELSENTIAAQSYFLLERTDDNTISDVLADRIYAGDLNNGGEALELIDSQGNLIDSVDSSGDGWFAGEDSPNYFSMERIDPSADSNPDNWASNNGITRNGLDAAGKPINGTPKGGNSVSMESTEVLGDRIFDEDFTLSRFGGPYIWEGSIIVEEGAKLTTGPGVEIQFKNTSVYQHAQLKVRGELEAEGAVFTSYSEDQPWDGIYFEDSISTLDNVTIRYGGLLHSPSGGEFTPYTYGAIYIDGGRVTINNSLIEKSDTFGLWLKNSTSSQIINTEFRENLGFDHNGKSAAVLIENSDPTIKNSIFRNNIVGILAENYSAPVVENNQFIQNTTPIQISSLLVDISDNVFENNSNDGVLVSGFGFSDSAQEINWENINAPYFVDTALTIPLGHTLKIKAGVEIRLTNNGQITADGNLQAQGTSQNKITFTGASEVPGAWKYIKFSASSADSILEHVIVSYGGYFDLWDESRYGAVKIDGLNLVIKNSVFENNLLAVELINAGFAGQSKDITIRNNEAGIYVTDGSRPDLSDVIFGVGDDVNTYDILPDVL